LLGHPIGQIPPTFRTEGPIEFRTLQRHRTLHLKSIGQGQHPPGLQQGEIQPQRPVGADLGLLQRQALKAHLARRQVNPLQAPLQQGQA